MSASINRTILKEFKDTNFKSFSDGQLTIAFPDENDLTLAEVVARPTGGYYEGGTFEFEIKLPDNYPDAVASITCKTKIFHPNINYTGYICFNILNDEWNPNVRLVDYAHALLWLLYQPNLESRLNSDCPDDPAEFRRLVRLSLQGKFVKGTSFPRMIEPEAPAEPARELSPRVRDVIAMLNRNATERAAEAPPPPPVVDEIPVPPPPPVPQGAARVARQPVPQLPAALPAPPVTPQQPVVPTTPVATTAVAPLLTTTVRVTPRTLHFVRLEPAPAPVTAPSARPAVRRWPPVTGNVRFVNGARAY